MRVLHYLAVVLFCCALPIPVVMLPASVVVAPAPAEKPLDGKDLFRSHCKSCHEAGSANGQYTPMSLTQDQWKTFFDKKFASIHQNVTEPKSGKKVTEVVSLDFLKSIRKFAVDHAADSEQPQTCSQ